MAPSIIKTTSDFRNHERTDISFPAMVLFDTNAQYMIADIMSNMMATADQESPTETESRVREKRQALRLSQKQLADLAGITRQAICAVEANQYSPSTSVALKLARVLQCKVEELFHLKGGEEVIEGELVGWLPKGLRKVRAQASQIGARVLVRPLIGLGELASLSTTADGLIVGLGSDTKRVKVRLFESREALGRNILVAGCDPAMFLAAERIKRHRRSSRDRRSPAASRSAH